MTNEELFHARQREMHAACKRATATVFRKCQVDRDDLAQEAAAILWECITRGYVTADTPGPYVVWTVRVRLMQRLGNWSPDYRAVGGRVVPRPDRYPLEGVTRTRKDRDGDYFPSDPVEPARTDEPPPPTRDEVAAVLGRFLAPCQARDVLACVDAEGNSKRAAATLGRALRGYRNMLGVARRQLREEFEGVCDALGISPAAA